MYTEFKLYILYSSLPWI